MPARPVPKRRWRSYGDDPLPTREEALAAPLRAFPSWFLRIECARCGREKYMAERHATIAGHGDRIIGEIIERMRHNGCGGRPQFVELITAIPGASRPVRRIVLVERDG